MSFKVISGLAGEIPWTTEVTYDFTTDMTSGSSNTNGDSTIYKGDGTTPKATITVADAGGTGELIEWITTHGLYANSPASGNISCGLHLDLSGISSPEKSVILLNLRGHIIGSGNGGIASINFGTVAGTTAGEMYGMRMDFTATNYTQRTRQYSGGSATNGSTQNSVTTSSNEYYSVQIQILGNRPPRVVWSVGSTDPGVLPDLQTEDGVTYFGAEPGYPLLAANTASTGLYDFSSTTYVNLGCAANDGTLVSIDHVEVKYKQIT